MRLSVATAILLALMCQGGEVAETHGSDLSLGEIELAASKGPTQLRSVHCRFTDSGAKGKEYELYFSGDKFRASIFQGTQPIFEAARNESLTQRFRSSSGILSVGRGDFLGRNPYGGLHPFAIPYLWLLADSDSWEITALRNSDLWAQRFKKARLGPSGEFNGHPCSIVEFDDPQRKGFVYRVYFAQDLDCYPIKWEGYVDSGAKLTSTAIVAKWARAADNDAIVPIALSYEDKGLDGISLPCNSDIVVDEEGLAINTAIDDAVFTLSRARATTVVDVEDYQKRVEESLAARSGVPVTKSTQRATANWWIVLNIAIVLLIVIAIVYVSMRGRKAATE